MTIRVTDTFTGTAGTFITAHTGETGATWGTGVGFPTPNVNLPVIDSTGGRLKGAGTGGTSIFASGVATVDGEYTEAVVDILTANPGMGVYVRAHANLAGSARGYMAYFQGGTVKILRLDNNTTFTPIGIQSTTCALPVSNGNTVRITATGTGSQVQLDVTLNGTPVLSGVIDSTAGRITTLGTAALYFEEIGSDTQYAHFTSIALTDSAGSATATITAPIDGKIAPLSGGITGTASIAVTGTYSGTAPDQWRLVNDGTSTAVTGLDWASFGTAPSAGAFAQTISAVPKGGWYNVQVRNSGTPGTVYTSGKVGAGVLVGVDGQSNAWLWFSADARGGDSTLTPNALLRVTGKQASNAWVTPTGTMNAAIACGNALVTALACPVGLVDGSFDGSGLTVTANGGQWVPTSGTAYPPSLSAMTAAGGKLIANIWIQGEADAGLSVTQANYYAALGTLIAQRRADLSQAALPYVVATLARNTAGMADTLREPIKLAQVQKCADTQIYRVDRMDLPLGADGIHHTPTGFTALGQRCAQAVLAAVGNVSQYRGPSFASVQKVSAAVFDVILTHHMGSDITPTSAITGFRVTDSGASNAVIAVSAAVRQATNKIRLTLASSPVALPDVSYLYGSAPDVSGVAKDNGTLTLPLEYSGAMRATALAAATSVTLTLNNRAGAAQASLSGLKWAFFDQATPDALIAPVVKGATETTDASGVIVIDITGSTLAPGATGWLVVSDSNGSPATASNAFAGPVTVA